MLLILSLSIFTIVTTLFILDKVTFLKGDFTNVETQNRIINFFKGKI